jgi:hypothetical protein
MCPQPDRFWKHRDFTAVDFEGNTLSAKSIRKGEEFMTIERAILLLVGVVVLGSVLLSVYHSPKWLWVAGLMGAHLIQASFTGLCPVIRVLKGAGFQSRAGFA